MTPLRLIGDVHGKYDAYKRAIKDVPFSLQVGDLGVGFRGWRGGQLVPLRNPPFDAMSAGRHLFIRGNHDNPSVCRMQRYWVSDGTLLDGKVFCLGGATSIDRAYRVEGESWWPDEECSYSDLQAHIDTYAAARPEIVVTHEAPQSVADHILGRFNMAKINDPSRTRQALQAMLEIHQPKLWVFGHWHRSIKLEEGRTTFVCLDELEHMDIDLEAYT